MGDANREGSLEAPTRHPLDWRSEDFYDDASLDAELERVFDICHGCRRCFNLCNAFPTLFDAVDESDTMEVDGVAKEVYWDVVDHCYLCDMCYMSKCPYVPPHEWNIDFPHLMLRAKAARFRKQGASVRDKVLSSTDKVGAFAGIPVVTEIVNATNRSATGRKLLQSVLGVHRDAPVPQYHRHTARKRLSKTALNETAAVAGERTRGKVVLYLTCYGDRNRPQMNADLAAVFAHNDIPLTLTEKEACCGMPKLELGDLEAVEQLKEVNIPVLAKLVDDGYDIVTPIPSCTLMYKQELPLMFPDDDAVMKVRDAMFDPFEYLMLRHKDGLLKIEFQNSLGNISYQVPCHLRVQNIGLKTRDILEMVPDTSVTAIERCSGHDGTYAVKQEFHESSKKIARAVVNKIKRAEPDHVISDCPMAAEQITQDFEQHDAGHPMSLLRHAYGI